MNKGYYFVTVSSLVIYFPLVLLKSQLWRQQIKQSYQRQVNKKQRQKAETRLMKPLFYLLVFLACMYNIFCGALFAVTDLLHFIIIHDNKFINYTHCLLSAVAS